MESGNDPFADAAPGGAVADDPFADAPPADDLSAEVAQEATADIPVVNREGESVTPPPPAEGADPAAAAPAVVDEAEAPVVPAVPEAPVEAPQAPVEAPAAPEAPVEAPQPPQEPETPAEAPAAAPQPAAAPAPAENGSAASQDAPKPKGEMRHYKALYQTAEKQWTEFPLTGELPEDVKVVTVEDELYFEARNNDHATRIAYVLLGQPEAGVTVWPVPKGAFKPKRVKPAPVRPERTRLEIS